MSSIRTPFLLLALAALQGVAACSARGASGGGGGGGDPDAEVPADNGTTGDDAMVTPDVVVTPDRPATPDSTATCSAPRALCGTSCVDTLTDSSNCGGCGRACTSGQTCVSGSCQGGTPSCSSPRVMCGSSCVDVTSDVANCGVCGLRCASGQTCSNGSCTGGSTGCASPMRMCGSFCTDVSFDANNCGACGNACPSAQACVSGRCQGGTTCSAPNTLCGSTCTNTSTDATNCGFCGNRCATGQTCSAGVCRSGTTTGSTAGAACTNPDPMGGTDPACGALVCIPTGSQPMCTDACTNSSSQATEQSMCGGSGSTCLTQGDAPNDSSLCTRACTPGTTSGAGACRTGFICTGWWFTHASAPDAPGCIGFCTSNAQCPSGSVCNTRLGDCDSTGVVTSRLADGMPCNPSITTTVPGETTPRNIQCRGLCFRTGTSTTQGICGSLLNAAVSTSCPDDPTNVQPLTARSGGTLTDAMGLCLYKNCTSNTNCTSPLICRLFEDASGTPTGSARACQYPTAAQPR